MSAPVRRLAAVVAAGLFASAAAAQTYYYPPPPSGQVVAASATITVRLPEGAVLQVNGKVAEGSGAVRTVMTDTIPLGRDAVVTLRIGARARDGRDHAGGPPKDSNAAPRPTGDDPTSGVTRTVTVRGFGTAEVDFTAVE
jgi:hypothetical protein